MARIKISSAKAKGRNLQNWVCKRLAEIFKLSFDNQNDNSEIASRPMGQIGQDIILRGRAIEELPFAFECKSSENLSITDSIKQAKMNEKTEQNWVVVHKRKSLKNPIVLMDWYTFEEMLQWKNKYSQSVLNVEQKH